MEGYVWAMYVSFVCVVSTIEVTMWRYKSHPEFYPVSKIGVWGTEHVGLAGYRIVYMIDVA